MVLLSADFWAGWVSGAFGVMFGNPMDKKKVHLQAQSVSQQFPSAGPNRSGLRHSSPPSHSTPLLPSASLRSQGTLSSPVSLIIKYVQAKAPLAETAAPMLGCGLLNGILFYAYNWAEDVLNTTLFPSPSLNPTLSSQYTVGSATGSNLWTTWLAGAASGLAVWPVSIPTELIKCRAQLASDQNSPVPSSSSSTLPARTSSLRSSITQTVLRSQGISILRRLTSLYRGGVVTALRDSIGYGFYFWTYEFGGRIMSSLFLRIQPPPGVDSLAGNGNGASFITSFSQEAIKVVLCGGIAGVVSWASIFPLDLIKTRVQGQVHLTATLPVDGSIPKQKGAIQIARDIYRNGGIRAFYPGLMECSKRAFIVNAIQWPVYKGLMFWLSPTNRDKQEELHL
ncbi:mitochondrial carrier domain-containing protein [Xylaria digitata]|nr:mitochondrial carrier domain-containing protein [Xylaria digitata]